MLKRFLLFISLGSAFFFACTDLTSLPESEEVLAEPISGLSPSQMLLHIQGDEEFAKVFSEAEGLGPIFVQNSCESCHVGDGKGNPFNNLTRFGEYKNGEWDPSEDKGGPQLQHRAIAGYEPEQVPHGLASSDFIAPNVTGLGFLGALSDASILAMADPLDTNGDGISGRVNLIQAPDYLVPDKRYHTEQGNGLFIGRFGRKAGAIDLLMQTVNAYKQDMGITSDFDPVDPINPYSSVFASDQVSDPEIGASTVHKVVFYLQTLKAPTRRNTESADVIEGERIFKAIGCENCHRQNLQTGPSEVAALDQVVFHPYTDMLMHDMGPELDDNYSEGIASSLEWRTTPLWGLGLQFQSQGNTVFLMHDGRAKSYAEAINLHGGEAQSSREKYQALSSQEKQQLESFLNSL